MIRSAAMAALALILCAIGGVSSYTAAVRTSAVSLSGGSAGGLAYSCDAQVARAIVASTPTTVSLNRYDWSDQTGSATCVVNSQTFALASQGLPASGSFPRLVANFVAALTAANRRMDVAGRLPWAQPGTRGVEVVVDNPLTSGGDS